MAENKSKKFVFVIKPENVKFIESLSYQDKQDIVNQLISKYRNNEQHNSQSNEETLWLKKFIAFATAIIIGIPLLLILLSYSLNLTKNSYLYMQTNFEKVYPKHQTEKYTY